jgi:hypothetical protein
MGRYVDIRFDCLPLRAVGRFDIPIDATEQQQVFYKRLRLAVEKHGTVNAYYLCRGRSVFHLTNDEQIGMLDFAFEGTVLTNASDQKTVGCDLVVELGGEVCDWLSGPAVEWFCETVRNAVRVEFDRYIAAGDLAKTIQRIEEIQSQSDAHGGFLGMGL